MTDKELAPCPFCGGEAELCEFPEDHFGVVCDNEDCTVNPSTVYYADGCGERAIAAWNTRASGWISVEERLPEDGIVVLWCGCDPKATQNGSGYAICEILKHEHRDTYIYWWENFTHWMPLPPQPATG